MQFGINGRAIAKINFTFNLQRLSFLGEFGRISSNGDVVAEDQINFKPVKGLSLFDCLASSALDQRPQSVSSQRLTRTCDVFNILIAFIIALFQFVLKKNPFAFIFGKEIPLPADIWLKLSLIWMIYFIFNAFVNMVVAFYLPAIFNITEQQAELFWVNYKSYGNGILNMIFALSTGFYLYKKNPQAFAALKEMRKG